ncbi:serine hydrolase [Anabaena sp. UHCC 0451]|uniref:serine hydrolase n=1 Tax=Anabaena sp. UHCC 0451 TaxID=2055235 RepID=UPI002B20620A|nr:serine hydrolase [Anabaena sp. UHCC 0451]MEA5576525.1 serine hydrolase [Anabaena sp. UHCC 0451]
MEQQSQGNSEIRDQKIADLEARLNNANQIIDHLQQQNFDLQKYINHLENAEIKVNSKIIKNNQSNQQHINSSGYRKIIRKSRFTQLSEWQFYGLTSLVVLSILILFGISTLFNNRNNDQTIKNTQQPSKSPTLPSLSVPEKNISIDGNPISPNTQGYNLSSETYVPLIYNVINPPNLQESKKLEIIIQDLTKLANNKNLPVENLSITLIDVNKKTISGYKQKTPRYPASVAKLFWMVALEAQINSGLILPDPQLDADLNEMILQSDNNASSRIIDRITKAQSLPEKLSKDGFAQWKKQRESVNLFFKKANYQDININQKTFPIPDLKINEPQGTDLQIRGDNPQKPIRNKITTYHAARLMYEILTGQAIGQEYSQKMLGLLTRDLRREAWDFNPPNPDIFNPVDNFFGEGLANEKVEFASKAGWTTSSRQEVAYVVTPDGKTRYILVIFGDDPAYGKSRTIFPEMSKFVFDRMTNSNP